MSKRKTSRREALFNSASAFGSAWIATHWSGILEAQEHAARAVKSAQPGKLQYFTPEQAAEIEAVTVQIIPTDDTPGAREAGSVHFIDRALATFDREKQPVYVQGLKDLQTKTGEMFPGTANFSALNANQQMQLLKSIERTPFFQQVRLHTVVGFFSNPEYGGNTEKIGWKLIGFEDTFHHQPPFGYYDGNKQA
ncbi:MAG TPA: gluconate 2-dehydrogenase subunit 3 family protein [Bryobacteraceae bacterium]|nr:gluconate 2-dehydrogenase subunit 3 family protein [Bryobacteraceae bacterium]